MQSNSSNSTQTIDMIHLNDSNPIGSAIQTSINNPTTSQMKLLSFAQSNDQDNFTRLLETTQLDLSSIKNSKGFNVLHFSCYNNNYQLTQQIITYQEQRQITAENMENFINSTTSDFSTPIHFAAFRGSLQILQLLKQKGANISARNNQGLNIMHLGAQGDQPNSIVFALQNGIKLEDLDNNEGSALHWACFYGQEHAVTYLLPLISKNKPYYPLNKLDTQKLTPLHLAVMNGSTRLVKKLLLYGADKNIKGRDNKTAANLAQDNEFNNIYNLLTKERSFLIVYYNLRQGVKRIRKSLTELFRFIGFFIFLLLSYSFYVVEDFQFLILDYIIFGMTTLCFILIVLSDPGYQTQRIETLYQLIQNFDHEQICPQCNVIKVPRTKHCDICQKCVLVYDHHCPWINNCVGAGNHVIFMIFIISLDITLIYGLVQSIITCKNGNNSQFDILSNETLFWVIMSISILIYLILAFGISVLIITQFVNIFRGQTTFERFALQNNTTTLDSMMKVSAQESLLDESTPKQKNNRYVKYSFKNFVNFCQNKSQYRKKEKEIRI